MEMINRDSFDDAKKIIEKFIFDNSARKVFIDFLVNSISYTDKLNTDNWSLNLDLNGKFLRFNVGQEYCITLDKNELLIVCNRTSLRNVISKKNFSVEFLGYENKKYYRNTDINKVPNLLVKTIDNVGCILKHSDIVEVLNFLEDSNKIFINGAILTHIKPVMKNSHSKGALEYIYLEFEKEYNDEVQSYLEFNETEQLKLDKAKKLTQFERLEILKTANAKPNKILVKQTVFIRNQIVVAAVLYRAKGKCEKCNNNAPFLRKTDNTPFLEVHHKKTLADEGDDTFENAIALCPNCHREEHYGKQNAI